MDLNWHSRKIFTYTILFKEVATCLDPRSGNLLEATDRDTGNSTLQTWDSLMQIQTKFTTKTLKRGKILIQVLASISTDDTHT